MSETETRLRELVAEVAAAYFSNSHVNAAEIPSVISQIATSLSTVGELPAEPGPEPQAEQPKATPAQIRKSISENGLVSFEDGRTYKTLRRHLSTRGLTPDQYRQKHGLPANYPMVSPSYSARRSELARTIGLGQKGGRRPAAGGSEPAAASQAAEQPKKAGGRRGRKPAAAAEE
jgi:predicted transcriptional regulator